MINVSLYQLSKIRKAPVIKKSYDLKIENRGIELIIDENTIRHQIIYKTYDELDRLTDIEVYELVDDLMYEDGLILRYYTDYDKRCTGRLIRTESYAYDNQNNMTLKYITTHYTNGNMDHEDHMYQYDYKNRVLVEAITKYLDNADSVIETGSLDIKSMTRINSYYDYDGNRFDTHIKIQENGYFVYELIKEVFIPAIQLYPYFQIQHVKSHGSIRTVNVPRVFTEISKNKKQVYYKTEYDLTFDKHREIIIEKDCHPIINSHHKLHKVNVSTYYKIEHSFTLSNNDKLTLLLPD